MLELYTYYRSSCAFRVRIALAFKGLDYQSLPVHLPSGQQLQEQYSSLNPSRMVPALVTKEGLLTQSLAIIEYLEEEHPNPSLLPARTYDRALVRSLAQMVAVDMQPLQNLRLTKYLQTDLQAGEERVQGWLQHFMALGFSALEGNLKNTAGKYCYGDDFSLADVCLAPQLFSAARFKVSLENYPHIRRIGDALYQHPAVIKAHPQAQPDFKAD